MIGETQEQQAPASSDLDFSTITPIDSGKPANAGSTLRQSVAFGVQQNPDEYAKLLKQQQVTGMSPEAARPFANDTQNAIDVERLNPEGMVDSHPRTAQWATNPDNAAVSGADELHRLTRIEQHAASMRAYTPTWEDKVTDVAQSAYQFMGGSGSLKQRAFQYPLARAGVGVLRGTEELLGNGPHSQACTATIRRGSTSCSARLGRSSLRTSARMRLASTSWPRTSGRWCRL
jgi:hypothetical protein